jgi:hypothetical protein
MRSGAFVRKPPQARRFDERFFPGGRASESVMSSVGPEALTRHPLFASLDRELLAEFCAKTEAREFAAHETILDATDRDGHVVFILAGEVAVMHGSAMLRVLQAPEAIGLLSALDGRPRSASVKRSAECPRGLPASIPSKRSWPRARSSIAG